MEVNVSLQELATFWRKLLKCINYLRKRKNNLNWQVCTQYSLILADSFSYVYMTMKSY